MRASMRRAPNLNPLSRRRTTLIGAAIGLLVAGLLALLRLTGPVQRIEWQLVDVRTRHFMGDVAPDPRIVLAVISEEDIELGRQNHYQWPWPLDINTMAFQWMAACGVAGVVVDVYHLDQGAGPAESIQGSEATALEAEMLADQYRAIGNVGLAFELTSIRPERQPVRIELAREKLSPFTHFGVDPVYTRPYARLPVAGLLRGARRIGFANMDTDADAIVRRTTPFGSILHVDPGGLAPVRTSETPAPESADSVAAPSLALAVALGVAKDVHVEADRVRIGAAVQRLDEAKSFLVNFRGPTKTYPVVAPWGLVAAGATLADDPTYAGEGAYSREALKGKIVVWGVNMPGNEDIVTTPVAQGFVGPELQATILDNLLNGDGRVPVDPAGNLAILGALCAGLGAVGGAWSRRGVFVSAAVLLAGATVLVAFTLFEGGTSVDLFTPLLGILLTYSSVIAFRLLTEGRRNKWLESTFGQYLSPAVIEQLKKDPSRLSLGGRRTEVSVLFSDIKGFTSISEKLSSEDLVRLLNVYLTGQSEPVLAEDGVIDKFIGDAVMAFFGDPIPFGDHAKRACRVAVRSQAALASLEPLAASLGLPPLLNRIGVNTGPAVLGNMGSDKRLSYTAMGDTVNLASRLEGANKAFGTRILLGPLTYEQAKDSIVAKPIGRLQVVGKKETVLVHELVALRGEAPDEVVRHADAYSRAHAAVLADDLEGAAAALEEAERLRPGDAATGWLRTFLEELRAGGTPRPWDGVVVLESKG